MYKLLYSFAILIGLLTAYFIFEQRFLEATLLIIVIVLIYNRIKLL